MQSSDDKQYPLAALKRASQPKRAVSKKDFRLPKPYRRQLFSEEPDRLTRLQVSLLGFAGVMVATLIGVLVLLADEKERSPHGKPIIVARAELEDIDALHAQLTAFPPPAVEVRRDPAPVLPHAPRPSVVAKAAPKARPPLRPKATKATAVMLVRSHQAAPLQAPDPDVALITAILLLTPPPAPANAPALSTELAGRGVAACTPNPVKDSGCTDLHKMKP